MDPFIKTMHNSKSTPLILKETTTVEASMLRYWTYVRWATKRGTNRFKHDFQTRAPTMSSSSTEAAKLQTVNYVNVAAYATNFLVVFGSTLAGLPDNATLSNKYQTIVTPAPYAFAIWGIIFTSELIWTIAQLFPSYRSHPIVIRVGYKFVIACFAQGLWTICFGLEHMVLSLLAMIAILIPLVSILLEFTKRSSRASIGEYWLLKFPFLIHASWIMAATLVNFNVVLVAYKASPKLQTIAGWISLVIVFFVGTYFSTTIWRATKKGVWVVPCVLIWASFAIGSELSSPRSSILGTFEESTIEEIRGASRTVAILLLLITLTEALKGIHDGAFRGSTDEEREILDSDSDNGNDRSDAVQYSALS